MKKIVIIAEANAISSGKFSTSCKKNVIPTLSKKHKKEATKYLKLLWFRLIGLSGSIFLFSDNNDRLTDWGTHQIVYLLQDWHYHS